MFLGFPGSGKTYFSKHLAKELNAITLNTDALRIAMFGSLDAVDKIRSENRSRVYDDVFGAMNYVTTQALSAGYSVIYDAQMTKRIDRIRIENLANEVGALPLLVWIKTSQKIALRRGQDREPGADSNQYTAQKITYLIDRFDEITDLPEGNENLINIDGEMSFGLQYDSFKEQLAKIIA